MKYILFLLLVLIVSCKERRPDIQVLVTDSTTESSRKYIVDSCSEAEIYKGHIGDTIFVIETDSSITMNINIDSANIVNIGK